MRILDVEQGSGVSQEILFLKMPTGHVDRQAFYQDRGTQVPA
jgi:hypothetical protein